MSIYKTKIRISESLIDIAKRIPKATPEDSIEYARRLLELSLTFKDRLLFRGLFVVSKESAEINLTEAEIDRKVSIAHRLGLNYIEFSPETINQLIRESRINRIYCVPDTDIIISESGITLKS